VLGLSRQRLGNRERVIVLAIWTIVGLSVLAPSSAHASGCENSWINSASGSWFVGANWSKNAPPASGEEVCITKSGTYTVEMTQTTGAGTVTLKSLKIGGPTLKRGSGTQTLVVGSSCSLNAVLTTTAGIRNGTHGAITLTNGDSCANSVTVNGLVGNEGIFTIESAHGGARNLLGDLTNSGTLAINANTTFNETGAAVTNTGTVSLSGGSQLTVSNGDSFTNGGGVILGLGGDVLMQPGTSFTEGAGKTKGGEPVIVDDGTLTYTGGGVSRIGLRGSSALSGNLAAGQWLTLESTCGEQAVVTAGASFTNGGILTLANGDGCAKDVSLVVSAGTLTNANRFVIEPGAGGVRSVQGNLTNMATFVVRANTLYNGAGAVLTNAGMIDIAEGKQLSVSGAGAVANNSGGNIVGVGSGALFQTGGTFTETTGKTSGTEPVLLDDATLIYSGTGTEHGIGRIGLRGGSAVSGNVQSGESLAIESTCSENAVATAATSFSSAGKIELTNGDGCANDATLDMKGGTLTNSGKLNVVNPHGGVRLIQGSLVNNSILSLAAGETLQISGNLTQGSAGKLKTFIAGTSSFGAVSVTGSAALAGKLALLQVAPFKGSLGQTYAVVGSSSLTGTFTAETGDQIEPAGLYYEPTYSATGVTLLVEQATLSLSASSGLPGSPVTLGGSGYLPGDTLTPTFIDHEGVVTVLPTVTTNAGGEYSTEITIPASAAVGVGRITVASSKTGVSVSSVFEAT
jgi:hypothetical protein